MAKLKPLGDSGVTTFGYSPSRTNEHLVELQGREGSIKYRQMSRGDAQIGMILKAHKNPIRSCSWGIPLPDDATDQEKTCIELLNKWLFAENPTSFQTLLNQILSCMEFGYSAFEKIYTTFQFEGNKYLVPILEQRLQTSIEEIIPDEQIVRQQTLKDGTVDIPFKDMVFFILNQQGEDMRGESLLRNAYRSWKRKQNYEKWVDVGGQRNVGGVPKMTVPKGTQVDSENYQAAEMLLQKVSGANENAYMIIEEGWEFELLKSEFDPDKQQKVIEAINSEMCLSVLAQFVLLGQNGNTGAYALSRDQSDFFLDGLQYIINTIELTFWRSVIRAFVKINFGDAVDASRVKLQGSNLNKKAGQELANVLTALKGAGFISATVDDEIKLRKSLEMPKLSEKEIEKRKEAAEANHQNIINPPTINGDDSQEGDEDPKKPKGSKVMKFTETKKSARRTLVDKMNKEMLDYMKGNLLSIKDKLMADIDATLNRGVTEIQGLNKIEVSAAKYQRALERKLAGIAFDAYARAKKDAKANVVKFAELFPEGKDPREIPNKNLRAYVFNQAAIISEKQVANMKARAVLAASNGPLKGLSLTQTLSNVSAVIDEYIDSSGVMAEGSLIVVGTDNFGAHEFHKEIKDQLWGYRFVAVDDERTSDICNWYNGKTFSVDSPELSEGTPPLHPNCRSYMEPIYKSEEKPDIEDEIAPPSIRNQKSVY